jgi:ferredoxin
MATIRFRDVIAQAQPGHDLLSQLLDAGADLNYICMSGSCGTCAVRVLAGAEHLEPLGPAERIRLLVHDGSRRLSCQAVVRGSGDVVVEQP